MLKRLIITYLLISIILLSSCNSPENKETVSVKPDENLPTLKVITSSPGAIVAFKMEEKYIQDHIGVNLEYYYPERLTSDLEEFLIQTDETFDILELFPGKIPLYVEENKLLELDKYIQSDAAISDVMPLYRKLYMNYNNHDYGMAFDGDSHLLFYRTDLFDKYNSEYKEKYKKDLTPPKTWEEYDQIAKFLTRDTNDDGVIDLFGTATLNSDGMRYIWFVERFLSMGGQYFDENMNAQIANDIGIRALKDLISIQTNGSTPPQAMYDWPDLNNAFLQGKVAMVVQWSDTARFSFDDKTWESKVANKVGWSIVPGDLPDAPRGGAWIGRILSISKESKHPDKAWEVIQHLTSKEISKKLISSYESINDPFRESHFKQVGKGPFPNEETNKDFMKTVYESTKNTNTDLMIPGGWKYMQILDRNIGLAYINKCTPEEALLQAAKEWDQLTKSYGRDNQQKYYLEWLKKQEEVRKQ